ncbi:MAG: hypothetical protein ACRENJ_07925 [Candidatus Eiseniibacteriota bacterium]
MKRRRRGRAGTYAQRAALRARGAGRDAPARDVARWFIPSALSLALILVGAVLLHHDALRLPFFADDYLFLEQVRGRSLISAVTAPDGLDNFFRPVGRQLYYWLLTHLFGESARAFHAANLVLFLGILTLLFMVARRLAGPMAAAVAAGYLALHYATDVPLRWVAGSQDLLAVFLALAAIALYLADFRRWAALPLLLALLSKETVLLTPLIAVVAGRRVGERWPAAWARGWPLGLAVAVWAALWLVTAPQRRGLGASLGLEPLGAVAVVAHLVHVALGLEWRGTLEAMERVIPPWLPLIPVGLAVYGARNAGLTGRAAYPPLAVGIFWALAAAAPLVAVAAGWSAYYYLFALCGVAVALGALFAHGPRWAALVIVVALAGGSQSGRTNPEFATARGAWTWQSHTNRRYIDRATDRIGRYLADMKRQRPTVPPRSTFFFAGLPAFLAWQTADGPLVRWAYRDTSLRSYYQADFTLERAHRGPVYFFMVSDDSLREEAREPTGLLDPALRTMILDRLEASRDLLIWLTERETPAADVFYFLAWLDWAHGDTLAARGRLARAAITVEPGPSPNVERAVERLASGDTLTAINLLAGAVTRHAFDPRGHAVLSDVLLRMEPSDPQARIEALAARVLAPEDGNGWLRWGLIQARDGRHTQAIRSLERSLALGLGDSTRTIQVRGALRELQRMVPGGELAQANLRHDVRVASPR